jgi:hypothetical protein
MPQFAFFGSFGESDLRQSIRDGKGRERSAAD